MVNKIIVTLTWPLVVIHFTILYFWIVDWEKTVTRIGLYSWIGSGVLGFIVCVYYNRKITSIKKNIVFLKKLVKTSTIMVIVLGILSVLITFATNSMP